MKDDEEETTEKMWNKVVDERTGKHNSSNDPHGFEVSSNTNERKKGKPVSPQHKRKV